MSGFVSFICFIFTPVVFLLNIITGFIIKLLGGNKDNGPTMTEEDLKTIVTVGHEEGVLEEEEKEMIVGAIMIFIGSLLLVACLNTFLL